MPRKKPITLIDSPYHSESLMVKLRMKLSCVDLLDSLVRQRAKAGLPGDSRAAVIRDGILRVAKAEILE